MSHDHKLVYFYLVKFRNLEDVGISFSSEFLFEFKKTSHSDGKYILTIINNQENVISDLFKIQNTSDHSAESNCEIDVRAIVGNNGSGKTTLLRLIWSYMNYGNEALGDSSFYAVFKDRNSNKLYVDYRNADRNITLNNSNEIDVELYDRKMTRYDLFENTAALYYTNVLNYNDYFISEIVSNGYNYDNRTTSDLSTGNLMRYDKRRFSGGYSSDPYMKFHSDELRRQLKAVQFFYDRSSNGIDINLEYLNIYIDKLPVRYTPISDAVRNKCSGETIKIISSLNKLLRKNHRRFQESYVNNMISHNIIRSFFKSLDNVGSFDLIDLIAERSLEYFTDKNDLNNNSPDIEGWLWYIFKELKDTKNLYILTNIIKYMRIFRLLKSYAYFHWYDNEGIFKIRVSELKHEKTDRLIKVYNEILTKYDFLHFKWCGASSGEISVLNLFGRINYFWNNKLNMLKYKYSDSIDIIKPSDIIIFIDEADMLFHPEWQRRMVYILVRKLPEIFVNKNIQIILATHSPIMLSDIPGCNVTYLRSAEDQNNIINNTETFGANIYKLYNNSFFMENGAIGAYAQYYIKDLISKINSLEFSAEDPVKMQNELNKRISLIGDDFLRKQLCLLLEKRIKKYNSAGAIERQIEFYEEMLEKLKKEKHAKKQDINSKPFTDEEGNADDQN